MKRIMALTWMAFALAGIGAPAAAAAVDSADGCKQFLFLRIGC